MDDILKRGSRLCCCCPLPVKIYGYAPITIAGQLCKDCNFRGPIVTLIVMQHVEILVEHLTSIAEQ